MKIRKRWRKRMPELKLTNSDERLLRAMQAGVLIYRVWQ